MATPDTPDWRPLQAATTARDRTRLNRAHRRLDRVARDILAHLHGLRPGQRPRLPDPDALAAAERIARLVGEIPWMP